MRINDQNIGRIPSGFFINIQNFGNQKQINIFAKTIKFFYMQKTNYLEKLWDIEIMLCSMVADYLDVNYRHIEITFINTDIVGPQDYFYLFGYRYRKNLETFDDEPEELMFWRHSESEDGEIHDDLMTPEEFDNLCLEEQEEDEK